MELKKPVHRKIIVPWYESLASCLITIFIMTMVFLTGLAGIFAALENPGYQRHIWVPSIFAASGAWVVISIVIRVFARYARRSSK